MNNINYNNNYWGKSKNAIDASFRLASTALGLFAGAAVIGGGYTTVVTPDIGTQTPEAVGAAFVSNTVKFTTDKQVPFIVGAAGETKKQVIAARTELDKFMQQLGRQGR